MSNYYELLKIPQSATSAEVTTAYETTYNYWRNLVNHHDPQMVQKANQTLLAIEKIRTTLLDPVKRANYDTLLLMGDIGGLADSSTQPSTMPTMTPPLARTSPMTSSMAQPNVTNSDSWPCSKCHSINAVGTRFCKKCGNQLGKDCPQCRTLLETSAQFCSVCGVNIRDFERELEISTAEAERLKIVEERRIAEQNARLAIIIKSSTDAMNFTKYGWIISIVGSCIPYINILTGLAGLGLFALAITNALKALRQSQQYGDQKYRSNAKTALWLSGIPVGLAVIAIVLSIVLGILSAFAGLFNSQ